MTEVLADRLREAAVDPFRFDEMLHHWNEAFSTANENPVTADVEQAADKALLDIAERDDSDLVGPRLRQLIHKLPHAALVVDFDGTITAMNEVAMRRTLVGPGDKIDDLPYQLEKAETLSAVIATSLRGRNSAGEVQLRRTTLEVEDRSATLAIIPSMSQKAAPSALVFLIDPIWRTEVEALVGRAFQLTTAESAVLMAFLNGRSLVEIAADRKTSLVTVRTQFQRLMKKTGSHSQAELLRNTLAISTFFQDMVPVAELAGHPHRKQFDVMRPGGRSLDVTLAGDMKGQPAVWLSTLSRHTLPAWYEAEIEKAGILLIQVWRQGHGRSDPLPPGTELAKGMAEDLLAPLDQLGILQCPLICFDASLVDGLRLTHHTAGRITRILSVSSFLPLRLRVAEKMSIPWAAAMTRASNTSPLLMKMLVIAGNKAWQAIGSRRFAKIQLSKSKADLTTIDMLGVADALGNTLMESIAQGVDQNCRTLSDSFGDWAQDLENACLPIEMIHGDDDPCVPLEDIRHLTEELFPDISLIEVKDAGFFLSYRHPRVLIDRVKAAHRQIN